MRFRLLAILGLGLTCLAGLAEAQRGQTASEQEQYILGEYWTVARQYQAGQTAPAVKEMSNWPQDRIAKVQATQFQQEVQLNDLLNSKAEWNPAVLRAAAMLHTDVGLAALQQRDVTAFQFHAGIADGWLNLADNRTSLPRGLRSRWNVAIARVLLLNSEFVLAEAYLDRLSTRIANDPEILLALATAKESLASRAATEDGKRHQLRSDATALFERALELDASLVEARLRVARLAIERGDDARAEGELAALLKATLPPGYAYLAHLWMGQVYEHAKSWNAAAQSYVEAVKAQPDGQSAYVALAQALHATGQPVEAAGVLEQWFKRGVTSPIADPWWIYPLGLDARLELRFDAIAAEVRSMKDAK